MKQSQKVRKVLVAFAVLSVASLATAEDVVFPNVGGGGDLASPAAWGMAELPPSTTRVIFSDSMTATATKDISFAGLSLPNASKTVVLDMRDSVTGGSPRKIELSAPINMAKKDQTLNLKGGRWDLKNQYLTLQKNYTDGTEGRKCLWISDGALVENGGGFETSYMNGGTFRIDGEGTVVTTKSFITTYKGSSGRFEVLNGASVCLTGTDKGAINIGLQGGSDDVANGNSLVVSNGASLVKTGSNVNYIGAQGDGNALRVLAGSTVSAKGLTYFGRKDSSDTTARNGTIEVDGAGSTLWLENLWALGSASIPSTNNVIRATNGGVFSTDIVYLRGKDNGFLISNGTVKVNNKFIVTADACNHAYVWLQGNQPHFNNCTNGVSGTSELRTGFEFRFDIPAAGYLNVPVVFDRYATSDYGWDVLVSSESISAALAQMATAGVRTRTYQLITFKGGLNPKGTDSYTAAQLKRWNDELPDSAAITWANGGPLLTLTVKNGMLIIMR